jgi:hypothetical protein
MLGSILFLIFVNELTSWIVVDILMFADDIRCARINNLDDNISMQDDLNKLTAMTEK